MFNDRGATLAGAVISDEVMPNVIQLATGAWYDPERPGGLEKHGNPNVLTRDQGTSKLGQGTSAHSCLVDIEKWTGPAVIVTAHQPPRIVPRAP